VTVNADPRKIFVQLRNHAEIGKLSG